MIWSGFGNEVHSDTVTGAELTAVDRSADPEAFSALYRLPRARWRSLGEHLDYTHWPDRERFVQLDREILASRDTAPRNPGQRPLQ